MSRRRTLLGALISLACAVALIPGGAAQAKSDVIANVAGDGWVRIKNVYSGLALQVRTIGNGAGIMQDTPTVGRNTQLWRIEHDPDGYVRFRNAASSSWYTLTVNHTTDNQYLPTMVYTNNPNSTLQKWLAPSAGVSNTYRLTNAATGKCLRPLGKSTAQLALVYVQDSGVCSDKSDTSTWWYIADND